MGCCTSLSTVAIREKLKSGEDQFGLLLFATLFPLFLGYFSKKLDKNIDKVYDINQLINWLMIIKEFL